MKLLLVTSSLDDGGAEKWMLDTVKNMDKTGVSIDYYFWGDIKNDNFLKTYEEMGVKLYFRKLENKKNKLPFCLGHDFGKFIKEHGPYDAVHVNGTKLIYQMIIMKVSKRMGIPVRMVHSHSAENQDLKGVKKIIRSIARRITINNATLVGGCSKLAMQSKYGKNIINNSKYFIFRNGIDYKKYKYSRDIRETQRKELNIGSEPVYMHIGRFSKEKNHIFIIKVFEEIKKIQKDAKLLLIGRGPLEKEIFDLIEQKNLRDYVIHVPYTTETEKYYILSDLIIFPSLYEGLPIVLLEAQASGLPCLISNTISNEIFINDNMKSLSLKDSCNSWSKTAIELFGNRCDNAQENIYNAGYDVMKTSDAFLKCCKSGEMI